MNTENNYICNLALLLVNRSSSFDLNGELYSIAVTNTDRELELTNVNERTRTFLSVEPILAKVLSEGKPFRFISFPDYFIDISVPYFNKLRNEANNNSSG